jgi:hypothetical protein
MPDENPVFRPHNAAMQNAGTVYVSSQGETALDCRSTKPPAAAR